MIDATSSAATPWKELLELTAEHSSLSSIQANLIRSMLGTIGELAHPDVEILDLKITDATLKELAAAFRVFQPYRHVSKLTMFGSARTESDDPIYLLAKDLAAQVAADGWMVVTGAGPGIMQAGTEGAGRERSFGVNIRLPHEQGANPFIALDPKLVEMRYFFTRKLILVKESAAYAVLPGGFGTLDEFFELLTLLQTGKALPAPIVLVETDGGTYWHGLEAFLQAQAIGPGYVSEEDSSLWSVVNTVDEAMEVIHGFYRNYQSIRMVGELMVIRLKTLPSPAELDEINRRFDDIVIDGSIRPTEPMAPERATNDSLELPRLVFRFNRTHYGRLRQLIDTLNECRGS